MHVSCTDSHKPTDLSYGILLKKSLQDAKYCLNKEVYDWIKRIRRKLSDKTGNKMSDR